MRILHVIPSLSAHDGGPGPAAMAMVQALAAAGHNALAATTDHDGPGAFVPVPLGMPLEWRGTPAIFFAMTRPCERRKPSAGLADWLAESVEEFDIVHLHGMFADAAMQAAAACRRAGVPYVIGPVGHLMAPNISLRRPRNLLKRAWLATSALPMIRGAAGWVYTSPLERNLSRTMIPRGRTEAIVPLGLTACDLADAAAAASRLSAARAGPMRIAFLGRLHPIKGFDRWIPALAGAMRATGAPVELHLAGPATPWSETMLGGLLARNGLTAHTKLHGRLEGLDKWDFLAKADLLLLLSDQENFGLTAVEAAAAGTPSLLSRHVGCAQWLDRAGVATVTGPETAQIAAALEGLLTRPEGARLIRERCQRAAAGLFGPGRLAAALARLYGRVTRPEGD